MKRSIFQALFVLITLTGGVLVLAADEKPATEAKAEKAAVKRSVKLTKPWSDLKALTPEQKSSILAIHGKAVEEKKAIEAKEEADIMALLTPEQKAELKSLAAEGKKTKVKGGKKSGAGEDEKEMEKN